MNLEERAKVVRAMETLARCVNDEELFCDCWLTLGVADGDIKPTTADADLEYYCEDDTFADIMKLFLSLMKAAERNGGITCDGIVSGVYKENKC